MLTRRGPQKAASEPFSMSLAKATLFWQAVTRICPCSCGSLTASTVPGPGSDPIEMIPLRLGCAMISALDAEAPPAAVSLSFWYPSNFQPFAFSSAAISLSIWKSDWSVMSMVMAAKCRRLMESLGLRRLGPGREVLEVLDEGWGAGAGCSGRRRDRDGTAEQCRDLGHDPLRSVTEALVALETSSRPCAGWSTLFHSGAGQATGPIATWPAPSAVNPLAGALRRYDY